MTADDTVRNARRCRAAWKALAVATIAMPVGAHATEGFGFTVRVSLSPKAAAQLAAKNQSLAVSAVFFGAPKPSAKRHADEMGQIDLGTERVALPRTGGDARVTGRTVERAHLAWIEGAVQVNVNVFSVRPSGPANILDCGLYEGDASVAAQSPREVRCKLIGED